MHRTKSLTNQEPKRIRRYDGTHVNMASYITDSNWHKQIHEGNFASSCHSPQSIAWQYRHTNSKTTCSWSQPWQEQVHRMHGSLGNNRGNIELNVNRLTATSFSKFGARLQQDTAGYNCNNGHEWIEQDMYNKTSLVNTSRLRIEWLVVAGLHSIII